MALEMRIDGMHFVVEDGCEIDTEETNITGTSAPEELLPIMKAADHDCKKSSNHPTENALFFRNISLVKHYADINVNLTCPACGNTYTIGPKEFTWAIAEYEKENDSVL